MKGVKDMLPERKQMILKAIIENYISSAEPVGSKALIGDVYKRQAQGRIRRTPDDNSAVWLRQRPG